MKGFSIIVCCYNSENVIEKTLQHLAALIVPSGHAAEVILVNNVSTDETVSLAKETWKLLNPVIELKVVDEDQPGLSYARNKGITTALYDYLLFCDDDNRLDPDYLMVAASILEKHRRIGVLGGLGIPDYESIPDYWSTDFYIYGSGPQAAKSGKVNYVHGAGIILRSEAYRQVAKADFKFLLTDRKGNQLTSGGDYELCYAIALSGFDIWYDKELTFSHYITSDRLTKAYCYRFIRESAPAIDVLDVYRYYLKDHNFLNINFYVEQFRLIAYHTYMFYKSHLLKSRYRSDIKIAFLEDFHIHFHKARVKWICRSFIQYSRWARQVENFKKRIKMVSVEESKLKNTP